MNRTSIIDSLHLAVRGGELQEDEPSIINDDSLSSQDPAHDNTVQTADNMSSSLSSSHFQYHRHMTRSDERAILGRAVLTTPHRRMPAIRIAAGPKPSFLSPRTPGPVMAATPVFVTKFSLCESLGCALRDLRVIDQFSMNERYSGPAFLARSNCVIVNVGHVRSIVMRDQVLIFLPIDSPRGGNNREESASGDTRVNVDSSSKNGMNANKMMETIECLVEALVNHLNSIYHSSDKMLSDEDTRNEEKATKSSSPRDSTTDRLRGSHSYKQHGSEWGPRSMVRDKNILSNQTRKPTLFQKKRIEAKLRKDAKSSTGSSPSPPFELIVIEALLGHVCSFESSKVVKLITVAKDILEGIAYNFNSERETGKKKDAFIEMQAKLGELLPLKNKVDELEAKCAEVAGAIAEVLKNDEDMAAMRLSENNHERLLVGDPNNLHVEVELLFEDYLLQMDEVLLSLRSVQNSVRNTEEVVEIELDLLRNRIMKNEMLLELAGLVVGVGAAVTGAFGMNLVNHFEEHPRMFYNVLTGLIVFMATIGYCVLRKLSEDNIL